MTGDVVDNSNTLVITDLDGNIYAIPREVVEKHKLNPEQIAAIEEQTGDDVAGFQMESAYLVERMAGFHTADRLREAKDARIAGSGGDLEAPTGPETGFDFRGAVIAVWRNLTIPPATSPSRMAPGVPSHHS